MSSVVPAAAAAAPHMCVQGCVFPHIINLIWFSALHQYLSLPVSSSSKNLAKLSSITDLPPGVSLLTQV